MNSHIDFPVTDLNLTGIIKSEQQDEPPIYNLIGVTNHYGSMGGGHYTAYAKNHVDKKWYDFNDSRVSAIGPR